jgi:hypothetical protein
VVLPAARSVNPPRGQDNSQLRPRRETFSGGPSWPTATSTGRTPWAGWVRRPRPPWAARRRSVQDADGTSAGISARRPISTPPS